jgi:hypothetical protein
MTARLLCVVTRDADRYAAEQGVISAMAIELERISERAAKELRFVALQFGYDCAQGTVSKFAMKFARELMEDGHES